ncbi:LIC_13387 family protein [Chitinophaga solisilvae]|uniref:LIC_13387 family protein n=1 Tax=Chitinophaga solisilvae TaxID=1233460 RepID=UPI00136AB382|nr:hypothetical protein [Chitinophaga solisilvae]
MIAIYLWKTGAAIISLMGLLHLKATLTTNKLSPRNEKLEADMKHDTLLLTDKLNMWKSWIGFNATHSIGAVFTGIVNFYLAVKYPSLLQSDPFIPLLTILIIGGYVWIAAKYWFHVVLTLLFIAWICFLAAWLLLLFNA